MKNPLLSALRRFGATACLVIAAMAGTTSEAHAFSCPMGKVMDGALCYSPPQAGYSCTGSLCMQNCPSGYAPSVPGFCHFKGALTYTETPYIDRRSNHSHQCLALFYADCDNNYSMDVCGICSYKGAWDITRSSYWRAPGVSPDFTQAFNLVGSTLQATYGSSLGAIQQAYYVAVAEIQKFIDAVLLKIFRTAAKIEMAQGGLGAALTQSATAFKAAKADPNNLNDIKRILTLVASNKQLANGSVEIKDIGTVMLRNAALLGVTNATNAAQPASTHAMTTAAVPVSASAYPSNMQNTSWGFFAGANGAAVAGVNESVAIVMNSKADADGSYQLAVLHTTTGTLGVAAIGGGDVGFMWNPGPVNQQSGPFIGLMGAAEVGAGAGASLTWSVAQGMRGAQNAIPGMSFNGGVGVGVQVSLAGGNTWVLQTFSFKP